ncbi:MAG: SAM-dependent methyltransferase, partial [Cellulomonadaceae bacterium]|nr:SAM-dependent methyltransferase [Cellulomonadaceae bacterium]
MNDVLDALTPWPEDGLRADGPVAVDATDRLLLDEAANLLDGFRACDGAVAVVGDHFGALTLGVVALDGRGVRVHTDAVTSEQAICANADVVLSHHGPRPFVVHPALTAAVVAGARLVLMQLPRSLDELREVAHLIACHASPDVTVVAGGRIKHMTPAMNDVLAESFADVQASLARSKSRLLIARNPQPTSVNFPPIFPRKAVLDDREIVDAVGNPVTVLAHGGVFAGTTL